MLNNNSSLQDLFDTNKLRPIKFIIMGCMAQFFHSLFQPSNHLFKIGGKKIVKERVFLFFPFLKMVDISSHMS